MPRIYMAGYFANLIYDIDMACQVFLCGEKDEASEAAVQALEDQTVMVEAIKSHERQCFDGMPTDEFDETFSQDLEDKIKSCELKIKRVGPWGESELWETRVEVHDTFLMLEKKVFRSKGLRFLRGERPRTNGKCGEKRTHAFERNGKPFAVPFGFLAILEDDFLRKKVFSKK